MHSTDEETPILSKTQKKQAMHELQGLGEALAEFSLDKLKKMALPEAIFNALRDYQRIQINSEGRRRQMQYIGKLMRSTDPEPIRAILAQIKSQSAEETARLHRLERLRDQLLEDEQTLNEIISLYPSADLQHLRALRRAALKEKTLQKPPRNFREIFQYLKTLEAGASEPI